MSMMPGNPCHEDADFPAPKIEMMKCIDCKNKIVKEDAIQDRCRKCHNIWLDRFIDG